MSTFLLFREDCITICEKSVNIAHALKVTENSDKIIEDAKYKRGKGEKVIILWEMKEE